MLKSILLKLTGLYKYNNNLIIRFNQKLSTAPIIKDAKGIMFGFARNFFFSVTIRPKYSNQINYLSQCDNSKFGIILQGTINDQKKFLIETLKIYKKIFKNSYIVVSTWKDEIKYKKDIVPLCDHIIFNEKPKQSGIANVNLQLKSTYSALIHLKKKKIRYSLKSRTDCRIYNPDSLNFLYNLIKLFPVNIKNNLNVKSRILFCSSFSCKYKIYGVTDILLFSTTDELLKYFYYDCFFKGIKKLEIKNKDYLKKNTYVVAETYLCASYLRRVKVKLSWTMSQWEEMLKNVFCIFDAHSVDFLWNKYERNFEQRRNKNYSFYDNRGISFSDWLAIYKSKRKRLNSKLQEKWKIKNGKVVKSSYF